jgi:Na+/H+ antiporter NhaC
MVSFFLPLLVFVSLYSGSSLWCSSGEPGSFTTLSPLVAMLPALVAGWFLSPGPSAHRLKTLTEGMRHPDIVTMSLIFLLAGAFSEVSKATGSVQVLAGSLVASVPATLVPPALFLACAFVSTAMGTSMGTIAALTPVALELGRHTGTDPAWTAGIVVSGAMFGDNLSLVSDTTIAACLSQHADMKAKLANNARVALPAALMMLGILALLCPTPTSDTAGLAAPFAARSILLLLPYGVLLGLAFAGVPVLAVLVIALGSAVVTGVVGHPGTSVRVWCSCVAEGFRAMHEIVFLSWMMGGLSALSGHKLHDITRHLVEGLRRLHGGRRLAQLVVAALVGTLDMLVANNTVAILMAGPVARDIARTCHILPHRMATTLDIFSCVMQGIIPWGAQIILVSSLASVSPLHVVPKVLYCPLLGLSALAAILLDRKKHPTTDR